MELATIRIRLIPETFLTVLETFSTVRFGSYQKICLVVPDRFWVVPETFLVIPQNLFDRFVSS